MVTLTYDPQALAATVAGHPLIKTQRTALDRVRGTLSMNPAVQRLVQAGATLKGNPQVLSNDVTQVIAATSQGVTSGATAGNADLASVISSSTALLNSPAWAALRQAVIPVAQERAFVPYLRSRNPLIVAAYMPPAQLIALELANQVDPPLEPLIKGALEILFNAFLAIGAILMAPEEITIGAVLAILGAVGWLGLSIFDYLQLLCSDYDEDGDCD